MIVDVELAGSWEKVTLGNVLSYIGNGLTDKQNKAIDGYPVTRIETISDDCINADKVGYINTLPEDKIEKYRLCYGDMLVSHINSDPQLGRSVIYEGNPEFLLHGMNLLRMRANAEVLAPFFLNLIFRFYRNRGVFIALASRAVGQSSINQSRMKSLIIPLPPLPEQRAIAHILQTIQEAKSARQRELELERERKAALMDHLFSYGTKGEPRKQTEIGEIPESWEVLPFQEITLSGTRNGIYKPKDFYGKGSLIADMKDIFREGDILQIQEMDRVDLDSKEIEKYGLHEGDLVFARRSFKPGGAGKCQYVPSLNEPIVFASSLIRVSLKRSANPEFYAYFFNSKSGRRLIDRIVRVLAVSGVSGSDLKNLLIPVLPTASEQRCIADILKAFDAKIAALEQETERLDELFHAMLDELMTGKRSAVSLIDAELPN